PAPLVGSLAGIAVFFIAALWGGVRPEWLIGGGKPVQAALAAPGWEGWEALPWRLVGLYGAALAVLASLDTLLTALVADVVMASRHDPRRELLGQGAGHLASAALGGMAGAGTTGATLVAIRAGGAGTPGWAAGAAMALVGWALLPWVVMLPTAALAGVIAAVGLSLIDRDIWLWWRMPGTRRDALIALLVAALAVGTDLMVAVAAGVALAVIEFVRLQAGDPVVLRRWTRAERPSPRRRPRKEREKLAEVGERIVGYDLRGVLFFGTVEHLREALARDLEAAEVVILDMRRVLRIDLTALRVLEQMAGKMRARGARLLISHAPANLGEVRRELHGPDRFEPYYP
ncbi:MAG: SulP family inorganic anion transporter, partial [Zetaproteobacteria bacterium]